MLGERVQGYNGPVQGLSHDVVDFERPGKYYYMIHAEMNALLFAQCNLSGATAYVTGHPCAGCMRSLLQVRMRPNSPVGVMLARWTTRRRANMCMGMGPPSRRESRG
eukprot:scaffold7519_cov417-Prasinococcus_capsulatus_cf.AAC.1